MCFMVLFTILHAEVKLPAIFSDNMVLQQKSKITIWGKANPNEIITIRCDWNRKNYKIKAKKDSTWSIKIPTKKAGGPYNIKINNIELKNIMFGEVWLCSGQSNMWWPLNQTDDYENEIGEVNKNLHIFTVQQNKQLEISDDCEGRWDIASLDNISNFSAIAYYFGKFLNEKLNVPIGLIHSSWGGSSAQAWTESKILENDPKLKFYLDQLKVKMQNPTSVINHQDPSVLFNGMINPLIPYSIKGAIWYQGESNVLQADIYSHLFSTMIKNWRDNWNIGKFPFYYVQIAPFNYSENTSGALLREAQLVTLKKLQNIDMISTLDIGNPLDIHPRNKLDVGKRLANIALTKDYGLKNINHLFPFYKKMKIIDDKIRLTFENANEGLIVTNLKDNNFIIAGNDKKFLPADVIIDGNSLIVSNDKIKEPVSVRYAFANTDTATLFNKNHLPASSFRTDDWQIVTGSVKIFIQYNSA